jgi:hypothetical protein
MDAVSHGRRRSAGGHSAAAISIYPGGAMWAPPCSMRAAQRLISADSRPSIVPRQPARAGARPGFSKILLGDDQVDRWEQYLDMMVESVFINSGRSCINCSGHLGEPPHARDRRCHRAAARGRAPLPPEHPDAALAAFTVPGVAEAISNSIDADLKASGRDRRHGRSTATRIDWSRNGKSDYLLPTVVHVQLA